MNLASLPSDIIRKVIRLELNSIDDMRLISPLWNALVLDHFNNRKRLPTIERVRWFKYKDGKDILYVLIPPCYHRYFGAEQWKNKADLVEVLSHILQRTSRVMNMEINMSADRFEQRAHDIGRVLSGDTIIEGLLLMKAEYFHQSVCDSIMNAVRRRRVRRVVLSPSSDYHVQSEHFKAHNKFVGDVAKCLGGIDMTYMSFAYEQISWDRREADLSSHLSMNVTMEKEPITDIPGVDFRVRFVLKHY